LPIGTAKSSVGALTALVAALGALLVPAAPAGASFPGGNGKIVFTGFHRPELSGVGVFVMNADGSDQTLLTEGNQAAWSPDGQRIAFQRTDGGNTDVYVMNADGTGITRLTDDPLIDAEPAWSPDGQRIVFSRRGGFTQPDLWTMSADGTDEALLTQTPQAEYDPRWSPDGDWIAYTRGTGVFRIHPDGTGNVNLTPPPRSGAAPDWSPDGLVIAYVGSDGDQSGLWTMKPDGTDPTLVSTADPGRFVWSPDGTQFVGTRANVPDQTTEIVNLGYAGEIPQVLASGGDNVEPDWQPLNPPPPPAPSYSRPKGASPLRASLVPAFDECAAPNRTHGAPLAFGSCAPPAQSSPNLTVGTPDSNGDAAASSGSVAYTVAGGDVQVKIDVSDVRCRTTDVATCAGGALSDYTGELESTHAIRVTDRLSGRFGTEAATLDRFQFPIRIPCGETASSSGATCSISTTFDTVLPGAIIAGRRAIWELGQVQVRDGGQDGSAATDDYATFMVQGLFIP
jgi:TolB protein